MLHDRRKDLPVQRFTSARASRKFKGLANYGRPLSHFVLPRLVADTYNFSDQTESGYSSTTVLVDIEGVSMDGKNRKDVYPGLAVSIVLKKDQRSGRLTEGIVKDILTSSPFHSRGIKVRLVDGQVGRVHTIKSDTNR